MKKSTAKARAWKVFSEYIRRSAADENGYVSCITCGETRQWNDVDAGHFIPKARGNAIYFVPENVHPQCRSCNRLRNGGMMDYYYPWMQKTYGEERIEELRQLSKTTKHYSINDYLEIEKEYKAKLNDLS